MFRMGRYVKLKMKSKAGFETGNGSVNEIVPKNYIINSNLTFIGSEWKVEVLPKFTNTTKYFIYRCPCHQLCGGFGDREKGMVAAYIIALLSNRIFGIDHKCPEDLSKYLKPNKVNWIIDEYKLKGLRKRSHYALDNFAFREKVKSINFQDYYKEEVIYWTGNQNYVESLRMHKDVPRRIPWLQNMCTCDVYKNILQVLFTPTNYLQKRIFDFSGTIAPKPLICAQIRIGRNPSVPGDDVHERYVQSKDMESVWEFLNSSVNVKSKLFIASDAIGIKSQARYRFKGQIVDTPGSIMHIDQLQNFRGNREEGFMKVILDQLILSHCSTLLISRSGFAIIGAYLRQDSQNLYCIGDGKVTSCKREGLVRYARGVK